MKLTTQSPLSQKNLLCAVSLLGLVFLIACSDEAMTLPKVPHVFSGNEVPPEVMNAPRVVPVPSPEHQANLPWLRLGDVPFRPKNFTPEPMIDASKLQMENERTIGEAYQQQYGPAMAPSAPKTPTASEGTPQ